MCEKSNASDGSWKKLVLAKTNDEWIVGHTVKTERIDHDGSSNEFQSYDDSKDTSLSPDNLEHLVNSDPNGDSNQRRRRKGQGPRAETPEERTMRLAKMSAYAAHRLANETPEQRAARLRRMSEYAARRLATESSEQRERRLARMSAYAARRLAEETADQRAARLARMSAYAARRHAMRKVHSVDNTNSAANVMPGTPYGQQGPNSVINQS